MLSGQFEQGEVAIIKDLLSSSDTFVDIGANIGFYTCLALYLGKHVIAIEPKRANLDLLFDNLSINGWTNGECEVFPHALSEKPGLANIYGATGTAASLLKGWAGHSERFSEIVPITSLDFILSGVSKSGTIVVKIDVEGAEYSVLRGAVNTLVLPNQIAWLIEICLNEYHSHGLNPHYRETFEIMWANGYQAYSGDSKRIPIGREDINQWVKMRHCSLNTMNFLFCRGEQ